MAKKRGFGRRMASPRTRTRTKVVTRFRNIGGRLRRGGSRTRRGFGQRQGMVTGALAGAGIGGITGVAAAKIAPSASPFIPVGAAGIGSFLLTKGRFMEKLVSAASGALTAYAVGQGIRGQPLIPANLTSLTVGTGGGGLTFG